MKQTIRETVTAEYNKTSRVRFVNWTECNGRPADTVRVTIYANNSGGRSYVGRTRASSGLNLNNDSARACDDCTLYIGVRNSVTRSAIHEFGHAAGLQHEHERTDRPEVCDTYDTLNPQSATVEYEGAYDKNSVMNYCGGGSLTTGDIMALDTMYPANSKILTTVNTVVKLVSSHSNRCLDLEAPLEGVDPGNGARVQSYNCQPRAYRFNQMWELKSTSRPGYFQLASVHNNRCLDVVAPNPAVDGRADGTAVQSWECLPGRENQVWMFKKKPSGNFELRSALSDKCLDIIAPNPAVDGLADGASLQIYACSTGSYQLNQEWSISRVTTPVTDNFSFFN